MQPLPVDQFGELLATPGVLEHCELRDTHVGFMAIHGGLEATTFEIAKVAADRSEASLYAVTQPDELRWHVPSHRYTRDSSPHLDAVCAHVDLVISLHGYGGVRDSDERWTTVLLGGSNREVAAALATQLRWALPMYTFIDDLDSIPAQYRGVHDQNPVNQPKRGGVQIELPPRIRGNSPMWDGADRDEHGFVEHTQLLVGTLHLFAGSCSADSA